MLSRIEKILFFLTILLLPTQLGKHFFPDFSLIYSLKIDYLSPIIYFWDLIIATLFITWVLQRPKINTKALGIFLFFLLTQSISLISAVNVLGGVVRLEQFLVIGMLGVYISSQKLGEIKDLLVGGLSLSVIYISLIAILEFLVGGSIGLWILGERSFNLSTPSIATFNFYGQVFLRPYSTFSHPNVLAGYLVLLLPLTVCLGKESKKTLGFLIVGLGSLSTVLSFSRGGLVVLILEALIHFRKRLKLLLLILILPLPFIYTRFNSIFNFDNLSLVRREELAEVSIAQFLGSPLFGVGINNFINSVSTSSLISGPNRFFQPVHNIFLLTLSETGLVGLVGFLGLILYPIYFLWKGREKEFSRMLLFCWVSILFLGMFDHYRLTLPQGQRVLFLVWGLSLIKLRDNV